MNHKIRAGFLGLGAMGEPMAHHLFNAGFLRHVFNRNTSRSDDFAKQHPETQVAASPADLARAVDVVFVCVSADQDVLNVIDSMLPALSKGQIVIDCSTVSRETAIEAGKKLSEVGVMFFDAPVTGGVEGARNATLSIMVGGEATLLPQITPLLNAISSRHIHMGAVGSGQAAKAVNQVMCAGINEAVTEALAFGEELGLDIDRVIDVIRGGAAGNWFLDKRGSTMTKGSFSPGFKVSLHRKDLRICLEMGREIGHDLPLTKSTLLHYDKLIADGHGDEDISSLYRIKRPKS